MKVYKGELSKDMIELGQSNRYSLGATSFGAPLGEVVRYLKKAVSWKGVKAKGAFSGDSAANARLKRALPSGTFRALEAMAAYSKKFAGIRGVAEYARPDGVIVEIPRKSALMATALGRGGIVGGRPSRTIPYEERVRPSELAAVSIPAA